MHVMLVMFYCILPQVYFFFWGGGQELWAEFLPGGSCPLSPGYVTVALPLETHFPKAIEQNSFQGGIKATCSKSLVIYGAISMHIIPHNSINEIFESTEIREITLIFIIKRCC